MTIKNNPLFWTDFLSQSENLSKPYHYPGLIGNPEEIGFLLNNCFENLNAFPEHLPQIRVFDERGGIRMDLFELLVSKSGSPIDSLCQWIPESLGISQFCVAFKNITRYEPELEHLLYHTLVRPYIQQFGIPGGGFEFYTFIGNYGHTPFGIHKDAEHSLLINLGPGVKKVWVWKPSSYIAQNCTPLPKILFNEDFLHTADHYIEMKAGDFYHIPEGMYHVLHSEDYSCMLGLIPYPATISSLVKSTTEASDSILESLNYSGREKLKAYQSAQSSTDPESIITQYAQMLESNGYFSSQPYRIKKNINDANAIKLRYPIFFKRVSDDIISITARMSVFVIPFAGSIIAALEELKRGEEISVSEFSEIMKEELDEDLISYIVELLIVNQIVKITQ
jgi:hypothetical protein